MRQDARKLGASYPFVRPSVHPPSGILASMPARFILVVYTGSSTARVEHVDLI